ncbi:PAS domain S-box protein [Notoacmeibacter marinus]|uniref:PAS domain S-box protein n=1 Tax=Notoacmeibacter marinus TaxID=1876515 RepID=UPI000DF2BF06|nr:PAS domain S-box protein [Notoacmeibacter marinus]
MPAIKITTSRSLSYLSKLAAIGLAYPVMGMIGPALTKPADYDVAIWPQAGLAIAVLILWGMRLWPGIFIGSVILSTWIVVSGGAPLSWQAIALAAPFAVGPTIQAVVAAFIARRLFGRPIQFRSVRDFVLLLLICGPLICAIAPTLGLAIIMVRDSLTLAELPLSWTNWWLGQALGVLIFLPLGLFGPWRPWTMTYNGKPVTSFTQLSVAAIGLSLCLTFLASGVTGRIADQRNANAFETLAHDHEFALLQRLNSYKESLDAAAGFFRGSDSVDLDEWAAFVDEIAYGNALSKTYGIGAVRLVANDAKEPLRAPSEHAMSPHWGASGGPAGRTVEYFSPATNAETPPPPTLQLKPGEYEAALRARDTGQTTLTRRRDGPPADLGLLIFRPMYDGAVRPRTEAQRRQAFVGWTYAQLTGSALMSGLTQSQGLRLNVAIFEGREVDPDRLIYSSRTEPTTQAGDIRVTKTLSVMGREWTLVWESTPQFDDAIGSREGILVLIGGLLASFLLSLFLFALDRREESIRQTVERKTREFIAVEQQNESIVQTAVIAIVVLDDQGRILRYNHAAKRLFDYGPDERADQQCRAHLGQLNLLADTSGPVERTITASDRHGELLHLAVQLNGWTSENDERRFTALIRDITGEVRATRALEETEERWKLALEGAALGVFDIDLKRGTSKVSSTWKTMLGFEPDASIDPQKEWIERLHPDDLPSVLEADRACIKGDATRSIAEYRIRHVDGHWTWIRSDAVIAARASDGTAIRMIGTQTDITELRNAANALQASEQKFRNAIEDAPVGMALMTPDRTWIKVNGALCDLLGYTEEELLSLDIADVMLPEDLEKTRDGKMEQVVAGELTAYQRQLRCLHKDGRVLWMSISVSLGHDYGGSGHLIIIFQDISEQKETERLKSEFVASVSHELRTPLTSVRGSLSLILGTMNHELSEGVKHLLTIAHSNSERLIFLVNDILDLEKMSTGNMSFDIQPEHLRSLIVDALEANEGYAEQAGIEQQLDDELPDVQIAVDRHRLHQVLANLLSNAVKFSPENGTVRIFGEQLEDSVRIHVQDNGPGISPKFRQRIFSRFAQADSSATRKASGTGLGLHLAKMMVEEMGGRIGFESEVGKGSTFWVDLPVANRSQKDRSAAG